MKIRLLIFILLNLYAGLWAQSRKDLEEQRKKTLEEIGYVDNMIKETEKQKTTGINDIRILGNRLSLRERILSGLREEIDLLNERIALNNLAMELMENDLEKLREEYANTVVNSYKTGKSYSDLVYLMSARDFNQGYKRLRYLQQMARFRRDQAEIITELRSRISETGDKLKEDLENMYR